MPDLRLRTIQYLLEDGEELLIAEECDICSLATHAYYIKDWLNILNVCKTGTIQTNLPIWWRPARDDAQCVVSYTENTSSQLHSKGFIACYHQYNRLNRRDTQVLAESLTNVALVKISIPDNQNDDKAFIVPLHLTVLADLETNKTNIDGKKFPDCISYPALSSILDLYSDKGDKKPQGEKENQNQNQNQENKAPINKDERKKVEYIEFWYDAINAGIQQGFAIYQNLTVGGRCWPDPLYFRWAIDLSPLYDAYYKDYKLPNHLLPPIKSKDRLIGGGSCGAAFALAAAQALARADRRGMFSVK